MGEEKFNKEGYYIQYLDDKTFLNFDEIIKKEFVEICCGYCICDYYDVSEIAEEFIRRINGKKEPESRKVGFIGELLYYVFAKYKFPFLKAINPMFNSEEGSFKKGFDMISEYNDEIWYSEVKSGEYNFLSRKRINDLNVDKLNLAYKDINDKLKDKQRNKNYWITAKMKVMNCVKDEEIDMILKRLDYDSKSEIIKNKIIVSIIFGKSKEKIDNKRIEKRLSEIREKDERVIIVCIRENTIKRTLNIIKELADNG